MTFFVGSFWTLPTTKPRSLTSLAVEPASPVRLVALKTLTVTWAGATEPLAVGVHVAAADEVGSALQ